MRISTASLHAQGLSALLARQADVARTQHQLVTGSKLSQAKEGPAAAATAQKLDHAVAELGQFARNSNQLQQRLEQQEGALTSVYGALTRARELAIQANAASASAEDRAIIAIEVRSLRESLVSLANRDDGTGRYLFAGTSNAGTPFSDNGQTVTYAGDDAQNRIEIAPDYSLRDTNPGSSVFLRVQAGNGISRASVGSSNSGTGLVGSPAIVDAAAWGGSTLTVSFTSSSTYEVLDGSGAPLAPPVSGTGWSSGQTISANGVAFSINGVPAAGDTFTLERAPYQDLFSTLDSLADALQTPTTAAGFANAMAASIQDLSAGQEHILMLRADTGSRLAAIDTAKEMRTADEVSLAATLSGLRDTDVNKAASTLMLQMTALEAAQATTVKVQGMSLFDYL